MSVLGLFMLLKIKFGNTYDNLCDGNIMKWFGLWNLAMNYFASELCHDTWGWNPSPFIRDEYWGNGYGGFHSWPKVDSLGDRLIGIVRTPGDVLDSLGRDDHWKFHHDIVYYTDYTNWYHGCRVPHGHGR